MFLVLDCSSECSCRQLISSSVLTMELTHVALSGASGSKTTQRLRDEACESLDPSCLGHEVISFSERSELCLDLALLWISAA